MAMTDQSDDEFDPVLTFNPGFEFSASLNTVSDL